MSPHQLPSSICAFCEAFNSCPRTRKRLLPTPDARSEHPNAEKRGLPLLQPFTGPLHTAWPLRSPAGAFSQCLIELARVTALYSRDWRTALRLPRFNVVAYGAPGERRSKVASAAEGGVTNSRRGQRDRSIQQRVTWTREKARWKARPAGDSHSPLPARLALHMKASRIRQTSAGKGLSTTFRETGCCL